MKLGAGEGTVLEQGIACPMDSEEHHGVAHETPCRTLQPLDSFGQEPAGVEVATMSFNEGATSASGTYQGLYRLLEVVLIAAFRQPSKVKPLSLPSGQ
jgi:hypothetical protein